MKATHNKPMPYSYYKAISDFAKEQRDKITGNGDPLARYTWDLLHLAAALSMLADPNKADISKLDLLVHLDEDTEDFSVHRLYHKMHNTLMDLIKDITEKAGGTLEEIEELDTRH